MKLKIIIGTLLLFMVLFLGMNRIYILNVPAILIISCICVTGLFFTGVEELLVIDGESNDATLGIINIFLGFILLSMTLCNKIII